MSGGRFFLDRRIFDHEIWENVPACRLFLLLIGKACFQDGVNLNGTILKRGQYLSSVRRLRDDLAYTKGRGLSRYSINTICHAITLLQRNKMIRTNKTINGTVFTVLNYERYQRFPAKSSGANRTPNRTLGTAFGGRKEDVNCDKNNKRLKNAYTWDGISPPRN